MEILERFRAKDLRALARGITWAESGLPEARELIRQLYPHTGRAHVVGITGPPGAGKSTLVDQLAGELRARGKTVAILAVDPSSPFTGGAILGDRIRMQRVLSDAGIYMRSLASRGHLGGVSIATGDAITLLDAFGFDVVLVETVGTGQSEVEIMGLAHTTLVVLVPGLGDDIQAIKAGILEIGDLFAINKADRDGAQKTAAEIEAMLDLRHMGDAGINHWAEAAGGGAHGQPALQAPSTAADRHGNANPGDCSWRPPVLRTTASHGQGVPELLDRVEEHLRFLQETGRWHARQRLDAQARLRELIALASAQHVLQRAQAAGDLPAMADAVADRRLDPYTAAEAVLRKHLGQA